MVEIVSKPATREYRVNYDRIFKKSKPKSEIDSFVQWQKEYKNHRTTVCVNIDPHFGG
jgi:hypothetical protein